MEKAKIKHAFKLAKAQGILPPTAELSPDALAKDALAKVQINEQGSPPSLLALTHYVHFSSGSFHGFAGAIVKHLSPLPFPSPSMRRRHTRNTYGSWGSPYTSRY
jgi:hypothetical protein